MDIVGASTFWSLWIQLLWALCTRGLRFSFLLGLYLGVKLLGHSMWNILRHCQTVFWSRCTILQAPAMHEGWVLYFLPSKWKGPLWLHWWLGLHHCCHPIAPGGLWEMCCCLVQGVETTGPLCWSLCNHREPFLVEKDAIHQASFFSFSKAS